MSMKITLFGFDACSPCNQLKRLFEKFKVDYEYIDIVKTKTEVSTAPTVVVTFEGTSKELAVFLRAIAKENKGTLEDKEKETVNEDKKS